MRHLADTLRRFVDKTFKIEQEKKSGAKGRQKPKLEFFLSLVVSKDVRNCVRKCTVVTDTLRAIS